MSADHSVLKGLVLVFHLNCARVLADRVVCDGGFRALAQEMELELLQPWFPDINGVYQGGLGHPQLLAF